MLEAVSLSFPTPSRAFLNTMRPWGAAWAEGLGLGGQALDLPTQTITTTCKGQFMADDARARRVAERIHETVARLLQGRIKDSRLGFITITDVRVTGDLQQAIIFYTVYGPERSRRESAAALKSATGLIRSEVGKALGIRLTPSISFQLDALPTQAKSFEDALSQAKARDAEIAAATVGATYAGDPDPYKKDAEDAVDSADDAATQSPGAGWAAESEGASSPSTGSAWD